MGKTRDGKETQKEHIFNIKLKLPLEGNIEFDIWKNWSGITKKKDLLSQTR